MIITIIKQSINPEAAAAPGGAPSMGAANC